jgi:uncharacterized protein (TIGR03067 family)
MPMSRRALYACLLVGLAPALRGETAKTPDKNLIAGRWIVIAYETNGVRLHKHAIPGVKAITFTDSQFAWDGGVGYGTFSFDESVRPKRVEYYDLTPGQPRAPYPGIYKLTDDRYRNCFRDALPVPRRFGTRAGDGVTCITYRRATEAEAPKRPVGTKQWDGGGGDGW